MTFADPSPGYWQGYGPFQHVKHRLIKHYLDGWFPKLGAWAGRVLYVDTHAGRGRHSSGHAGSPLVALDTLLRHSYRDELLKKSEVGFLFIERDPANLNRLKDELDQIGDRPGRVHVSTSAGNAYRVLSDLVEGLQESGRNMAPAFVFVDPYGFRVPGHLLAQLMGAGRVELFVNVIWRELDMAIQQRQPPGHGLATTLDEIFAGNGWRTIDGDTADDRMDQVVRLLSDTIGAKWHTYIRMSAGGTATRYLLLHLTNHDQGRDLMKECIWRVAPDGGFEVRQRHDHRQPLLITPEPDLAPLQKWLLERLRQRPHTRHELRQELRSTLWLPPHLRQVVGRLLKARELDESARMLSLPANPQLPLL